MDTTAQTTQMDMGNGESLLAGIVEVPEGFLALAFSQTKTFKTFRGAAAWLARRNCSPSGQLITRSAT